MVRCDYQVTWVFAVQMVATVRLAEPTAHGASEWVHVVLLAGGILALIAVVLGQWVGTLLTIFVTNNFKVGISLLSREACWTAGKASDDEEENRARTQRNLLFSLWVLGTDTALLQYTYSSMRRTVRQRPRKTAFPYP
jgi:hypothetical protein